MTDDGWYKLNLHATLCMVNEIFLSVYTGDTDEKSDPIIRSSMSLTKHKKPRIMGYSSSIVPHIRGPLYFQFPATA